MAEPVLQAVGLVKRFDGVIATNDVTMDIRPGEIHAVIGPNGAGKSTLIAQLSGELRSDDGRVLLAGEDVTALPVNSRSQRGIARSYQTTSIFPEFTVLDNVALGIQARSGHSFRFWRPARLERELREPAMAVLEEVGLASRAHVPAGQMAHGEKRQVEIAMALAGRPKVLLLDEPLAGMGHGEGQHVVSLIDQLRSRVPILLVEHDMDAVFALADRITVLVYGRIIASGPPDAISKDPEVRTAYLSDEE